VGAFAPEPPESKSNQTSKTLVIEGRDEIISDHLASAHAKVMTEARKIGTRAHSVRGQPGRRRPR
jgi:hypothetical protein